MKPIKIHAKNAQKIRDALAAVNGNARSFTITSISDVWPAIRDAEQQLSTLPKADRVGASFTYTPAGPSASSYKYAAVSTCIHVERRATGWFLVDVRPDEVRPRSPERLAVTITPEQCAEIQRRAVAGFKIS